MGKIKSIIYLIMFFACPFAMGQVENYNVIQINDINDAVEIGKKIQYYEEEGNKLDIKDVLTTGIQNKFQKGNKVIFAHPAISSGFWFKFSIKNNCSEDVYLEVGSTYAWYIDFYKQDSLGRYIKIAETGTMRPEQSKFFDHNLFWLPVNKANQTEIQNYYIRIESSLPLEIPLQVGAVRALSKKQDIGNYLTGGFVGLMIIMLLYNLFLYISTRDHDYFWYLGYLFLMIISMPYANSHPFIQNVDFWFFDKQWWNNYFLVWHSPVYFFIGMFCIKYLNLKEHLPTIYKLILFEIILLSVVSPILNIVGVELVKIINLFQIVVLLLYLTCLISAYYMVFKGHKFARYYVLGWTFMIVHVFIFFATVNGYFPYNNFSRNALYFGVGLEVWMFSLALGDRINIILKEKDEAQLQYVKLVYEQNETLQKSVNERTLRLKEALEEIEAANAELQAQADQLVENNKTKDKLFSIIGHDLKSPVASLKMLLDMVLDNSLNADKFQALVQKINLKVDNILFLLSNLLEWATSQRDGIVAAPESVSLHKIVVQNIQLLNTHLENKKIHIINQVPEEYFVWCDSAQLNIIIRNLTNNAMKFTNVSGTIKISAQRQNEKFIQVSVTDNGLGMDEKTLQNLFDPYLQVTYDGTHGESGTGLGLVLCKDFITKNGGKIWANSKEKEGSTFYFTLPIAN